MTLISHAQNFEDVMLWRALRGVEKGFYIDVGAWSPDIDSVTRSFYERGWRGVNIEPNPKFLAQLDERRPEDVNLGVAVGGSAGEVELHIIGDTGLSTTHAEIAEKHKVAGFEAGVLTVPRTTLTDIWRDHVAPGQEVHFLKVDAECDEAAILGALEWTAYRPWIVVVEATEPNSQVEAHGEWEGTLLAAGYAFAYFDGLNRFYVADEHKELLAAFSVPPNVFDDYIKREHADALHGVKTLERDLASAVERSAALEASLAAARNDVASLEVARDLAQRQADEARAERDAASRRAEEAEAQVLYVLERPLWQRALFRPSGRPKKALRRILFHKSGKPRKRYRNILLDADGAPRKPFARWMSSHEYTRLPGAYRAHLMAGIDHHAARLPPWRSAIGKSKLTDAELDALMDRVRSEVADGA